MKKVPKEPFLNGLQVFITFFSKIILFYVNTRLHINRSVWSTLYVLFWLYLFCHQDSLFDMDILFQNWWHSTQSMEKGLQIGTSCRDNLCTKGNFSHLFLSFFSLPYLTFYMTQKLCAEMLLSEKWTSKLLFG